MIMVQLCEDGDGAVMRGCGRGCVEGMVMVQL